MFYECALGLWEFSFNGSTEISARFLLKDLCKYFFTKNTFRKDVHADFTDIWMLTSSCPFLTPTGSPQPVRIVDCNEILARGLAI